MAINVLNLLGDLPEAQQGYFTRAQAAAAGLEDFELTRSVQHGFINRLDHGVYRVAGAGHDLHEGLRVAWFRLQPNAGPRDRIRRPTTWVSHTSAASLHGFGVYLPDTPTFITVDRLQPRKGVTVHRRSAGLESNEYTVIDGFAVTTIARTAADLARAKSDGGHLGRFIDEALRSQAVTLTDIAAAMRTTTNEVESLIAMGSQRATQ